MSYQCWQTNNLHLHHSFHYYCNLELVIYVSTILPKHQHCWLGRVLYWILVSLCYLSRREQPVLLFHSVEAVLHSRCREYQLELIVHCLQENCKYHILCFALQQGATCLVSEIQETYMKILLSSLLHCWVGCMYSKSYWWWSLLRTKHSYWYWVRNIWSRWCRTLYNSYQ